MIFCDSRRHEEHQCELLAVMDNRVCGDGLWGLIECAVPIVGAREQTLISADAGDEGRSDS